MVGLITACGDGDEDAPESGIIVATVTRAPEGTDTPVQGPEVATATPAPPAAGGNAAFSGFIYPLQGACLPEGNQLMPNAPRAYRNGTHEGIDFYAVDNCTGITLGTPVMAAKAGRVIRVDHDYVDLTPQTLAALSANPTTAESLDAYRGRQVWIDHGDGVVTRYCHLSGVVSELKVNDMVAQGQTIAYVGESGTPGSVEAPGSEYHLHWEVRVGTSYLGAGQDPAQIRELYLSLFNP